MMPSIAAAPVRIFTKLNFDAFYACMPSKALLRPGEILAEARRVPGAREALTGSIDVAAALARRDEVIKSLDDSSMEPWLSDHGVELVRGRGRLAGPLCIMVDGQELIARRAVVVATGSAPVIPPIEGLDAARREARRGRGRSAPPAGLLQQ